MSDSDYVCGVSSRNSSELPIVLSGCSGGGKSTLLNALSRRGYATQSEPGRQIVREQLAIGGSGIPWDNAVQFMDLTLSRAMYLYNTAPEAGQVFMDRSVLDCAAAYEQVLGRMPTHVARAVELYRYYHDVYMLPPWEEMFATDKERRHSFHDAVGEYERLISFYERHGYRTIHVPRDSIENRVEFIARSVEGS